MLRKKFAYSYLVILKNVTITWFFFHYRASVLSEVQTSRSSQLPASKNLLVLGDKESGKTTLIAKLQGNEDPKKGAGLEYGYINVRDEYRDGELREDVEPRFLGPCL